MFSSQNEIIMIFGVLLALSFIVGSVFFVYRLFVDKTKDILVKFILLVFSSLVAIFIVDKIVAFKINLLSPEQNNSLFDLIKTLVLMIFSYYFGTQKSNKEE
jgi:hypothetical protein